MAWPDGLFNATPTNLDALAGVYVTDWSGLLAPGVRDGQPGLKIPYADGDAAVPNRSFAPYQFEIPLTVLPEDGAGIVPSTSQGVRAQLLSNLTGIKSWLVNAGAPGVYSRRVSDSASTYATHTALLSYEGGLVASVRPGAVRADLTLLFVNHDGAWLTAVNEVQTVTVTGAPTGGTFTLTFSGRTTAAIAFNAAASAVQSALEALANVGAGNVTVTGAAGGPYTVTFVGTLGGRDVAQMTVTASLTGGTTPGVTVATTTNGSRTLVWP